MKRCHRRGFLARLAGAIALPAGWSIGVYAQQPRVLELRLIEPLLLALTNGVPVRKGRVALDLPQLADNGNAVLLKVSVESPMSATDHVKSIHLISNRNPVAEMASFYLGSRAGRAQVVTRVRLAGSQTVTAIAVLSDGTFWMDSAPIVVTLSSCLDES
jgi:sulfur-oxidizing protein SoxY